MKLEETKQCVKVNNKNAERTLSH